MQFNFQPYPFEKLRDLFSGITPPGSVTDLSVGEPKFQTPQIIQNALAASTGELSKYPKTLGEPDLSAAQRAFFARRFGIALSPDELLPTLGTREVLFNFPQFLLFGKQDPTMCYTNPFYQIYEGAAKASRARVFHISLEKQNGFKPVIDTAQLKLADLVILNFPNNPTGSVLSVQDLARWVSLALEYDFFLLNDECYSEIYTQSAPPSILQACKSVGNDEFKNVFCVNSISKRSAAPGLRSGFIAGDTRVLKQYAQYRTYLGAANGNPMQRAAAAAWQDESGAEEIRKKFAANTEAARKIFGSAPEATFYLWLEVQDDLLTAQNLLKNYAIKVLPGSFLGRGGAGRGFIRVALVEEPQKMQTALEKLKECLSK